MRHPVRPRILFAWVRGEPEEAGHEITHRSLRKSLDQWRARLAVALRARTIGRAERQNDVLRARNPSWRRAVYHLRHTAGICPRLAGLPRPARRAAAVLVAGERHGAGARCRIGC